MILESEHATVYADVVAINHAQEIVLVSMAGARTAVKAIHAALRSSHKKWLLLYYEEGGAEPVASVRGAHRYRVEARPLPSVRGVQMVMVAQDETSLAGYGYVTDGADGGAALVRSLEDDPRLVVPVLPAWGAYLQEQGLATLAHFPEELRDAPARLVEPLRLYGRHLEEGYLYARDIDTWLSVVDEGLKSAAIALREQGE